MFVVLRLELVLRSKMRVRILRAERVKLACKRQAREYSPLVKIPPYPRTKVLRRLASIVCYSAVRMRRMTQYTASGMRLRQLLCLQLFSARARRRKQLSTVSNSLTRHFDPNKKCQSPLILLRILALFYFLILTLKRSKNSF